MLRATAVQITVSASDLEAMLAERTVGQLEELRVALEEGAVRVAARVTHEKLPFAVPVEMRFTVRKAEGTVVELGVTWSNLPLLPGFLKELALRKAFEALPGRYEEGVFTVDGQDVMEEKPVSFRITGIAVRKEGVQVGLADLMVYPVEAQSLIEATGSNLPTPSPSKGDADLAEPEHQSYYQRLRERMKRFATEKVPKWAQPLVPWVLAVPDFFVLVVRLARDERVPAAAKLMAGAVVAYFLSPVDLIPDLLPFMGQVDDVAVALFALEQIAQRVQPEVVQEHWPGEGQVLEFVKSGTALFNKALPAKMLAVIRKLLRKD